MKSRFFTKPVENHAENLYKIAKEAAVYAIESLGIGHSERTYESVIQNVLYDRHIPTKRQARYFSTVDGNIVETGILDLEVDHCLLLEFKVGHECITKDHKVQISRYLRSAQSARAHKKVDLIACVFLFSKRGVLKIYKISSPYKHHT